MEKKQLFDTRLANFTGIDVAAKHTLKFNTANVQNIVDVVRRHADLPYIYLMTPDQKDPVGAVLASLKAIRSTCYPYAVFMAGGNVSDRDNFVSVHPGVDVILWNEGDGGSLGEAILAYAKKRFVFDEDLLKVSASDSIPAEVDVVIVGAGVTGLYAANRFVEKGLTFAIFEKNARIGGIWNLYANATSQVNTSEPAYRLIEKTSRVNSDHSRTREILEDMVSIARASAERIFLDSEVVRIEKTGSRYVTTVKRSGETVSVTSKGVILAINDRVGEPREIRWPNQETFRGTVLTGISNNALNYDWAGKRVVVTGMGAFAIENVRTALENGAAHVTVVCRRHGTVCPKIIDYLNFASPYDENFQHEKKSNMRNMLLWKKLYDTSGATQPECWMGKIKHTGHTISVSDIWFIAHYLKKLDTVAGAITAMEQGGVIVNGDRRIDADVVVNCVGFHRNTSAAREICGYDTMYNVNYVDRDFMYLADAFIDDDVFNSFFGSSVLEMVKFYMNVYLKFFDSPDYETMIGIPGVATLDIDSRSWSHYIAGAMALMAAYPDLHRAAKDQVDRRSKNFHEFFDLTTYITSNKREWLDTHSLLAGRPMAEGECLPYVFEKLIG